MPKITEQFIRKIPKTDLHLHLDGSLRLPTLIEMARQEQVELPSYEEAGLNELVFKEYVHCGKEFEDVFYKNICSTRCEIEISD